LQTTKKTFVVLHFSSFSTVSIIRFVINIIPFLETTEFYYSICTTLIDAKIEEAKTPPPYMSKITPQRTGVI